jgi:hypothetical protein
LSFTEAKVRKKRKMPFSDMKQTASTRNGCLKNVMALFSALQVSNVLLERVHEDWLRLGPTKGLLLNGPNFPKIIKFAISVMSPMLDAAASSDETQPI